MKCGHFAGIVDGVRITARLYGAAMAVLACLFSYDVLGGDLPAAALAIHLIPGFVMLFVLLVSVSFESLGAVFYVIVAVSLAALSGTRFLALPLLIIVAGFLFAMSFWLNRRLDELPA